MSRSVVDCACVIHGNDYGWFYVEKLYSMLCRNLSTRVQLHVFTEPDRTVPAPFIKHSLDLWNTARPIKSWWYKMQLFNCENFSGDLLYFDLDTVIVSNINWLTALPTDNFWALHDFKYLWRPSFTGINSSVMWWNTRKYHYVWEEFCNENVNTVSRQCHGDQDFISAKIPVEKRRFINSTQVQSWRWQALDGGYDFKKRKYMNPGSGTTVKDEVSIMVFHGQPKPHEIVDPVIQEHWK